MDARERRDAIIRIDRADTWDTTNDMDNLINWYKIDKDVDFKESILELVFKRIIYLHNRDCIKDDDPLFTISCEDLLSV